MISGFVYMRDFPLSCWHTSTEGPPSGHNHSNRFARRMFNTLAASLKTSGLSLNCQCISSFALCDLFFPHEFSRDEGANGLRHVFGHEWLRLQVGAEFLDVLAQAFKRISRRLVQKQLRQIGI